MNRRSFLTALGLILGQVSCQNQETKTYLRIGINDWIGYAIARYTKAVGIFAQRGLEVDFIDFLNLQDATRAMMSGSLDASFSTL
jgi:ABC-type nitrate/sulfonate/bicarbonate transport system substrate-binding protein